MRAPNTFLFGNLFYSITRWVDRSGPVLLWPAIWVDWNIEPSIGVRTKRWTLGLGRGRIQLDWSRWERRDPATALDWAASGLDGFLVWSRQLFNRPWGRSDLDRLFKERPEWRHLVVLGGGHAHYVRLLLARELFEAPQSTLGPERRSVHATTGLSALEAVLDDVAAHSRSQDPTVDPDNLSAESSPSQTVGTVEAIDMATPHIVAMDRRKKNEK